MGGVISRMEEVAPTARNTGKSPAMQTQSLKAIPPGRSVCPVEPCATDRPHPSSSSGCTPPIRRAGYAPDPASHGSHNVLSRGRSRSEEHTSELQSLRHLVCRLLLEKNQ